MTQLSFYDRDTDRAALAATRRNVQRQNPSISALSAHLQAAALIEDVSADFLERTPGPNPNVQAAPSWVR